MTTSTRATVSARLDDLPAWVVVTQIFIGLGWLRAATEKLIDPQWWAGERITDFLAEHDGLTVMWYRPFVSTKVAHILKGMSSSSWSSANCGDEG